jgi:hypothetical protein
MKIFAPMKQAYARGYPKWHGFVKIFSNYQPMKKCIFILGMLLGAIITYGQSPAPDPDTIKNPVKQIDPEVKQLPPDLHYAKDAVRINADELPPVVLKKLQQVEPTGWEKSVVYRGKKEKIFIVEMRDNQNTRTYRFDTEGKLLKDEDDKDDKN